MAAQETEPNCRPRGDGGTGAAVVDSAAAAADDFEFSILPSGGLLPADSEAADMCVADEVFSQGKLLPLRLSSSTAADASGLLLLRSESVDCATTASTAGFSSWSDSRGASSSSSSCCVSRSHSSKSASSSAVAPPWRSLSSSMFFAHPSPSPQLRVPPRRSTGSAPPPAAWRIVRLGVVGAPDVYPPHAADARKAGAARCRSRSARLEQGRAGAKEAAVHKKPGVAFLGGGLGCKCSPDAVEPVSSPVSVAAAAARRTAKRGLNARRSRILEWLEGLSISKEKNAVSESS